MNASYRLTEQNVGNIRLIPRMLLDSHLEILIPAEFQDMSDELLQIKYPNQNRPSMAFSNTNGSVSVAINYTKTLVLPSQLGPLQTQLENSVRLAHPNSQWTYCDQQIYHGRVWVRMEFCTLAIDTRIHNLMLATSANNRMLAIAFNVTEELSDEWLTAGREIVQSAIYRDG